MTVLTAIWMWLVANKLTAYVVFSVLVERLPPPTAQSSSTYTYVYGILQLAASNTKRGQDAVKTRATV